MFKKIIFTREIDPSLKIINIFFVARLNDPYGNEFSDEKSVCLKNKSKQTNQLKSDEKRVKKSETKPYQSSRRNIKDDTNKQENDEIKYVISSKYFDKISKDINSELL